MKKLFLIVLALMAQTCGGLKWSLLPIHDPTDKLRQKDCWGFFALEMAPHWKRYNDAKTLKDTYEALKNIVSEWARTDPANAPGQRATKIILAWCFMYAMAWGLIMLLIGMLVAHYYLR